MRAVLFPAADEVRMADLPHPLPGRGEAVVRVRASGLCHTDVEVMHGRYGTGAFPLAPGHEFAGEVAAAGEGVSIAEGTRVVVDPNLSCGTCRACRRGHANLCETLGAYGVTRHGGFAEYVLVRAENLVAVDDLDDSLAALAEPVGCVLTGVGAIAPEPRDRALIFGAGPIGLLFALVLKSRGLSEILVADVDPARITLAESFGFAAADPRSDAMAANRHAWDLVIDATGRPEVAAGLPDYAYDAGRCLFFGVCPPAARIEISPFEVFRRQLTLVGTHSLNHNIPEALDAIRAIGPEIGRIVSHRMALDEIAAVLGEGPPPGSLKIQTATP